MTEPIEKNKVLSPKKLPEEGGQINKDPEELNEDTQGELAKKIEKLKEGSKKIADSLSKMKKKTDETGSENNSSKSEEAQEKSAGAVPPSVKPESQSPIPPKTQPAPTVSQTQKSKNKQQPESPITPTKPSPPVSQTQSPKVEKPETPVTDVSESSKVKSEQSMIPETPKMDKLSDQELRTVNHETVKPSKPTIIKYKINGSPDSTFEGECDASGLPVKGKVTFTNGSTYEGSLDTSGNQNGPGELILDGNVTTGVWKKGKLFQGITKDKDGVIVADYRDGKDKFYTDYNGDVYRGQINGSLRVGKGGSVVFKNGDRFVGDYNVKGQRHGPGKFLGQDGRGFEGEYKNGLRFKGEEKKADGTRYIGGYDEKGLWSGDAKEITLEGNVKKGIYREGKLYTGEVTSQDGKVIERYRGGKLMVTDSQKDTARLQAQELLEAGGVQISTELIKNLNALDVEVFMSPERLRGIQGDIAQKMAQSKTGVVDPSKASDTEWNDFLNQRNEVRKQMGLEPYPIISLDDFKISKPKNYLDHLARLEFVTRNTDNRKILGSLVDFDHYFMSPRLQKQLDSLQPGNGTGSITSSKKGDQNILTFGKDDKKEQWNINELGWDYKHDGTIPSYSADANLLFHKKGDDGGEISFVIPASKAFQGKSWNEESIQQHITKAYSDHLAEKNNQSTIAGFDLPKDRPVGFISVDAPRDNAVRSSSEGFSHFFPDVMREQGYDIRSTPQTNFIGENGVHSNIQTAINTQRKNGVKDIYLQLNGHGSQEDGLFFNNKDWYGSQGRITKAQFSDLLRANPDMHFTINTIACHNAGLTDVMKKLPKDIQDRVTFFAGTKKHVVNNSSGVNDENTQYTHPSTDSHDSNEFRENSEYSRGTIYEQYLGYYLSQGKTYGEAHWLADKKTQENSGLNPEAVYRGDLYVSNGQEENPNFS